MTSLRGEARREERPSHPHTTRTYLVAEIEADDLKTSHRRPHQRVVVVTIAIAAAAAVAAVAHRCGGVVVVVVFVVVGGGGGGGARVEEVARAKPRAAACDGEGGPTVGAVSVPRRSRVRPVPQPEMWRGRRARRGRGVAARAVRESSVPPHHAIVRERRVFLSFHRAARSSRFARRARGPLGSESRLVSRVARSARRVSTAVIPTRRARPAAIPPRHSIRSRV